LDKKAKEQAIDFALKAAEIAAERHCTDVVVIDLNGKSPATDLFVIATGTSERQMRTVCDEISAMGRECDFPRFGRAGYDQARWILLDFVSVVVHLFDQEYREFYDLDNLWDDVKITNIKPKEMKDEFQS